MDLPVAWPASSWICRRIFLRYQINSPHTTTIIAAVAG